MTVWIIVSGEPVGLGGTPRILRGGMLTETLADMGHRVVWWASTFDHAAKRRLVEQTTHYTPRPEVELILLDGPPYAQNVSLARVLNHRGVARAFRAESASMAKPDVIFAALPTLELCDAAIDVGARFDIPVVVDVRDKWPDVYVHAFPKFVRPVARAALTYEFRRANRILGCATAITAVSEDYLEWSLRYAGRPRGVLDQVFPLGYPASSPKGDAVAMRKKLGLPPDRLVASFIGTFGASYDLETVVEAARILEREGSQVTIVAAGTGDKATDLRARGDGLSTLTFTGWLDASALQNLLAASSVGLAPYVAGALQSLPNKPFEYMSAGLPIVSSLEGELEGLIAAEGIGIHYSPGDALALADALNWMIVHCTEREAMGRRARDLLERRFSAEAVYPALARHLEVIASCGG